MKSAAKVVCKALLILAGASLLTACAETEPPEIKIPVPPVIYEAAQDIAYLNSGIDYTVLVDSGHPLPEGWEEKIRLEKFTNAVGDEVSVEKTAYEAYLKMKEALEAEDVYVDLDSAYRSVADQQAIVDEFTEKYGAGYAQTYAAVPGTSEHHTGIALDLFFIEDGNIIYENEDLLKYPEIWEKIHAKLPEYGFILRYTGADGHPYEPWHIRYVGTDAAKEITEKGITLEEYLSTHQ
jgi:D-alanyl-D-alanine carboxypeptidase